MDKKRTLIVFSGAIQLSDPLDIQSDMDQVDDLMKKGYRDTKKALEK